MRRTISSSSEPGRRRTRSALGLQDLVNFVFDGPEFGLGIGFPYPANQGIQCVQWTIVCEWRDSQKFPGRREDCCEAAQNHWRQIDPAYSSMKLCWVPL